MKKGKIFILILIMVVLSGTAVRAAISYSQPATHTKQQIISYIESHPFDLVSGDTFATEPSINQPYAQGKLSNESTQNAINALNGMRYIAGVGYNVTNNSNYESYAQAAALVNKLNGSISHYPRQPDGLDSTLFQRGYTGASNSCVYAGSSNSANTIMIYIDAADKNEQGICECRRWLLSSRLGQIGVGQVGDYNATYVMDSSNSYYITDVAWPARVMPLNFMDPETQWTFSTVTQNIGTASSIRVRITRRRDNKVWNLSSSDITVNEVSEYGYFVGHDMNGCIVWSMPDVGGYHDGDVFDITITGSLSSKSYSVEFFDITDAKPTFTPEAGTYTANQKVTISSEAEDATIYYTTDGRDPTTSSLVYSDPITVSETTTIRAMAVIRGIQSEIAEETYTIQHITPHVKDLPEASAITCGEDLSKSTLTGGTVQAGETDTTPVNGTFTWKDAAAAPTVTGNFTAVFTPESSSYSAVEVSVPVTVQYAVRTVVNPAGCGTVQLGAEKAEKGTKIEIKPSPAEGYSWNWNCITVVGDTTSQNYTLSDNGLSSFSYGSSVPPNPYVEIETENITVTVNFFQHQHEFTYSADGEKITAVCGNTDGGCTLDDGSESHKHATTLTIVKPTLTVYGGTGSESATLTGLSDFNQATGLSVSVANIRYVGRNNTTYRESAAAPTNAGDYTAKMILTGVKTAAGDNSDVTASVDYSIAPITISSVAVKDITAPTAGEALDITAATDTANVTLNDSGAISWSPAAADGKAAYAAEYTAVVTAMTDANSVFADNVTATVNTQTAAVTRNQDGTLSISYTFPKTGLIPVTITATNKEVSYSTDAITISVESMFTISEGAGAATYSLTNGTGEGTYDTQTGKLAVTKCGTFTVKASTAATETYAAGAETSATLKVNKVAPTVTAPTAKTLTYNGQAQELVTAGSTNDGTLYYAVTIENTAPTDDSLYTTSVPKATNTGTYCVWYKVLGDSNHNDTEPVCIEAAIKARPYSGGGSSAITIPLTDGGNGGTVNITGTISGSTVSVDTISEAAFNKAAQTDGSVVIDVSGLKKDIKEIRFNAATVKNLKRSNVQSLEIILSDGSITLDRKAIDTLEAASAGADPLKVHIEKVVVSSLTKAQQEALKYIDSPIIFDVTLTRGNVEIHDLNGGKVTIKARYECSEGKAPDLFYLTEAGVLKRVANAEYKDGFLIWTGDHCSVYVVKEISIDSGAVNKMVDALGEDPDPEKVAEAKTAYEALGDKKMEIDGSVVKTLEAAEQKVAEVAEHKAALDKAAEVMKAAEKYQDDVAVKAAKEGLEKVLESGKTEDIINAAKALDSAVKTAEEAEKARKAAEEKAREAAEEKEAAEKKAAREKAAKNKITPATLKTASVKLKKAKYTIKGGKTARIKVKKTTNGKVTFKKTKGNKNIIVSKAGKIKVKKDAKKGKTYTIRVKISSAKTSTYKAFKATRKIKIKVK